ncbi:MAG: putative addiction module antidote protein [Acidobacteriota bacterium]|nr:putative addiction module antidote protein [Acidobacteriota bacterium]
MPKRTIDHRSALLQELQDPQTAAHYINASLEDSEDMLLIALRDVAEAKQMSKVAEDAGVAREALYKMLSEAGNPRYSSLAGVLSALKLRIRIEPIEEPSPR